MEKGILLILSGFAGSGKGTIVKELTRRYDSYALSISATTRAPRPGEEDGREYFFKTREEFENYLRWLSVYEPEFFMEFCEGYMVRWCMQQLGFKWASRYGGNKS